MAFAMGPDFKENYEIYHEVEIIDFYQVREKFIDFVFCSFYKFLSYFADILLLATNSCGLSRRLLGPHRRYAYNF